MPDLNKEERNTFDVQESKRTEAALLLHTNAATTHAIALSPKCIFSLSLFYRTCIWDSYVESNNRPDYLYKECIIYYYCVLI